jgi:hypothetical protein
MHEIADECPSPNGRRDTDENQESDAKPQRGTVCWDAC